MPILLEKILVLPLLICRRIRFGYAFRRMPLTRGKYAIVDTDDYYRLARHMWYALKGTRTFYVMRSGKIKEGRKREPICMHREVLKVPKGMFVDHINHNGLDNRKANLRPATIAQNNFNTRKRKCNSPSKYKGIHWQKDRKKWSVKIQVNRKIIRLGCFDNEITAAKAYDEAARKYHGQFACLNFKNA